MSTVVAEVIDSSEMEVLAEFAAEGEIVNNTRRFRVGTLGSDVVIAGFSNGGGWSGDLVFERANLREVAQRLRDVLDGKLREHTEDYFVIERGKDDMTISAHAPRYKVTVHMDNARAVYIDGSLVRGGSLIVSPDTAYCLHDELNKLIQQGVN